MSGYYEGNKCECCSKPMFVECAGCHKNMDWRCFDNHECAFEDHDCGEPQHVAMQPAQGDDA